MVTYRLFVQSNESLLITVFLFLFNQLLPIAEIEAAAPNSTTDTLSTFVAGNVFIYIFTRLGSSNLVCGASCLSFSKFFVSIYHQRRLSLSLLARLHLFLPRKMISSCGSLEQFRHMMSNRTPCFANHCHRP